MHNLLRQLIAAIALLLLVFGGSGLCAEVETLAEGIRQYQQENYEEAIEILRVVRRVEPANSSAAFFLGLAYKQANDIQRALPHLQAAVTLKPAIKEAVVELIDVLIQLERIDEAERWVATAEQVGVYPAKVAFLKGMILSRKGKADDAIASFEKAKTLERSYTQAADFQIGVALLANRSYAKAKERFQAAVTQDPLSDLASFARRYRDIVEEQSFLQRPLRFTLGLTGQYDTNMLIEPKSYPGLADSGDERSLALAPSFRMDYVPILPGKWLFNGTVASISRLYDKNAGTYDIWGNTISLAPGYDFGRFAVNLSGNYTFTMKKGDYSNNGGDFRRYMENFSVGPLFRFMAAPNHILELYAGYAGKNYFKPAPAGNPGDDMTAYGFDSYASWMWLLSGGGLINTRFSFSVDNAAGAHFTNRGYKLSVNSIYPLMEKLNLQIGGEAAFVPYMNQNENFDDKVRSDQIFTGIVGLIYTFNRYVNGVVTYTGTRANSNIYIYDYGRNIWSAGIEVRF